MQEHRLKVENDYSSRRKFSNGIIALYNNDQMNYYDLVNGTKTTIQITGFEFQPSCISIWKDEFLFFVNTDNEKNEIKILVVDTNQGSSEVHCLDKYSFLGLTKWDYLINNTKDAFLVKNDIYHLTGRTKKINDFPPRENLIKTYRDKLYFIENQGDTLFIMNEFFNESKRKLFESKELLGLTDYSILENGIVLRYYDRVHFYSFKTKVVEDLSHGSHWNHLNEVSDYMLEIGDSIYYYNIQKDLITKIERPHDAQALFLLEESVYAIAEKFIL